jgi:hypothetical protein
MEHKKGGPLLRIALFLLVNIHFFFLKEKVTKRSNKPAA